jgi:hypothetical protein
MSGPQVISNQGICGSFSLLFLLVCVLNNDLTSGEIIGHLVNLFLIKLQYLMRQFTCYIKDYTTKNGFCTLQLLYDKISPLVANIPELSNQID